MKKKVVMFFVAVMIMVSMCIGVLAANISQTANKYNQDYVLTLNGSYSDVLTCTGNAYAYTYMSNGTGISRYIQVSIDCWDNNLARTIAYKDSAKAVANSIVSSPAISRGRTATSQVYIYKGVLHGGSISTTPIIDSLTYTVRQDH